MRQVEIRAATPEDRKAIKAVFKSHDPSPDWKLAKRYFRSYFAAPERHQGEVVLVATLGGRVAGVIGHLQDRREAPGIYWLGWYYVHAAERGHGIGTCLLDHVVAELARRGARKLYTDTSSWKFYESARHRYAELGFELEGRLLDYYEKGEHQLIYAMDLTRERHPAGEKSPPRRES